MIDVANVRFTAAQAEAVSGGLIGWVGCTLGDALRLEGLMLRRTVKGKLTLSFPSRIDGAGRRHFFFRPINERVRRHIEAAVFRCLGLEEAPR